MSDAPVNPAGEKQDFVESQEYAATEQPGPQGRTGDVVEEQVYAADAESPEE